MTQGNRLTYALMVGAFLLACLSAYLLVTQARSLTLTRDQLEETTRNLNKAGAELKQIRGQVDDFRNKLNLARSGNIYLVDSMEASQDFLADQSIRVKLLCAQTNGADQAVPRSEGDGLNLGDRIDDADFISFCRAFSEGADLRRAASVVAIRRATATSPEEYAMVASEYERLIPKVRTGGLEAARIYEGLAYSRFRQGRIDDAVSAIRKAQNLAPDLALPAMTSLKIDCRQRAAAQQVRGGLQALRGRLDAKVVRIGKILEHQSFPAMERALRYAKIERRMVEQDPELYELCSYAGLVPQT